MATFQREPAFSIAISEYFVNSMFGKYRRGVAACMYFWYYVLSEFMLICARSR
jgi:hypothetical protein